MIGIKRSFKIVCSSVFLEISRLIKLSFVHGSNAMFFSLINISAPMVGISFGLRVAFSSFIFQVILKKLLLGMGLISLIGYHIPHFFAAAYFNSRSKLIKSAMALVCMLLFLMHPQGLYALPYAMLWLIPLVLSLLNTQNIFLKALGSTFIAHGVGSVIWIYSVPMTSLQWVALIPVVLLERLMFASGIVVALYVINFAAKKTFSLKFNELLKFS